MTLPDLDDLAARFRVQDIPRREWTHAAHLIVGLWHVERFGPEEAIERLRHGIRALNERNGVANTETGGYHETITVAFVRLLDQFRRTAPPATARPEQIARLLAGPLTDPGLLLMFWSRDLLMSPRARATWQPPDLAPLTLPAAFGRSSAAPPPAEP